MLQSACSGDTITITLLKPDLTPFSTGGYIRVWVEIVGLDSRATVTTDDDTLLVTGNVLSFVDDEDMFPVGGNYIAQPLIENSDGTISKGMRVTIPVAQAVG